MAIDRNAVNWFERCKYVALTCLFLLLVQTQIVFGQVDQGAVSGVVQDASGAVIPNAKVTLLNKDQGLSLETTTKASGEYIFTPVRIGNYSLSVTAPGFSTTTQENLQVSVQQHLQVNVELKTGATTETVEVNTTPPLLQTEEGSVGQVINERSVNSLPLNGRNFTFLAQLGAGVNTPQADTRGNAASGAFTANGLRPAQNNYLLDGIDNNSDTVDFLNGTNFIVLPPVDAIQEFKVQTADFSADLGRAGGAVLNATIKSGTNSFHGAVWEFLRNDKLDAADWFTNNNGTTKGELRLNQFGASIGGPILRNKLFFFGDYEGLRVVQGTVSTATVPTLTMRNSGYSNLSDIITGQGGTLRTDALGRQVPLGTVLDPATTRTVTANVVDPVSGIVSPTTGFVRDPFGTCSPSPPNKTFSLANCNLNHIPVARLDPNAIKLLNLYPAPTNGSLSTNFASAPKATQDRNAFDVRADFNPSDKNQIFFRFSYVDDPQFIPGVFGGIADGGAFQQGIQTAKADQAALGYTHAFTPSAINVARAGFNHLHTTRFGPEGNTLGIPAQFGIQGIPQVPENGGLPGFTFGGLSTLGGNNFLPSDEVSQTLQITDDFTKIYGKHNFKMGIEYQHVKFSTLQPAYSRGQFDHNGTYTDIPTQNSNSTGIAQFLLQPQLATVPNGVNYSGGANQVLASNISKTYDEKNYFAAYFQDDWKITPRLTLNLGLRWDYFGPISESNGAQANFIESGPPLGKPVYLIPTGKAISTLSPSFTTLLAKDGITLVQGDQYGKGLVETQKNNFAPRVGFAYQLTPKAVFRGGTGLFYNSFENQGYGPNIGENYPFVYNFNYQIQDAVHPVSANTPYSGCATAGPGGTATFEAGLSCVTFTPANVNAQGLQLQGLQFNYQTPVTLSSNLTFQYSLTPTLSMQLGYVNTNAWNLQTGVGNNNVTQLYPAGTDLTTKIPFPDFSRGGSNQRTIAESNYNGLQTKLEQQYWKGFNFLAAYTWSKTLSDAFDLLNGGSLQANRANAIPGFGLAFDRTLASFDLRNVFHFSGGYQLPFGKDKQFLASSGKLTNAIVGGWSGNWIVTIQGGQPITLRCPSNPTAAGTNCDVINVPGQSQQLGLHIDGNKKLSWYGNPKAFQQPCLLGASGPIPNSPPGCALLTGNAILGGNPASTYGPPLKTFDFSLFKAFQLTERFSLQFRTEFFNIFNHANFNAPGFGGNGVVSVSNAGNFTSSNFGEIGSTRTAPRQVQFALKLYY
jgi:hypothetical protein